MASDREQPQPVQPLGARLACGCAVIFRVGVEGSPVSVVVDRKAPSCTMALHVAGLPVYDHREAIRPSTRVAAPVHSDYEES